MITRISTCLAVILLLSLSLSAQEQKHIRLTKHLKDSLETEIETMLVADQKYRWMLMFGEMDEQKLKDWKAKPDSVQFPRFKLVMAHKAGLSATQSDSLGKLQGEIDSVNFYKLTDIIKKYGFPHKYIASYKVTPILMHSPDLMNDTFFNMLREEVNIGNLKPLDYANLYDNVQWKMKRPQLYFVMVNYSQDFKTQQYGTPTDLERTNKARKEIGLKKFKQKK